MTWRKTTPWRPKHAVNAVVAGAVVSMFAVSWAVGGFPDLGATETKLKADDPRVVGRGEVVYMEHCASCHGRALEGEAEWKSQDGDGYLPAPPHDESGHTWHHPDKLLFKMVKFGVAEAANLTDYKTKMPSFGESLSDAEIVATLSYIKSRWPQDIRSRHDQLNRIYEERERSVK